MIFFCVCAFSTKCKQTINDRCGHFSLSCWSAVARDNWWCDAIFDDQWKLCLVANSVNVICVMVNGPNVFVLIHFICRFICHFLSFHFVSSSVPFINCATLSKSNILPSEKWQHKTSTLQCNGALQLFARASSLSDGNRILMTFTAAKLILPTRCCSKRLFPWIALASTN